MAEKNLFGDTDRVGLKKPRRTMTTHGYAIDEVKSALQKAIRRGQEEETMFWAREMAESGMSWSLWQRLKVIAVEDCAEMQPLVFVALCAQCAGKSREPTLFAVKAALELARCEKDRTADDYVCWIADKLEIDKDESVLPGVPDEALDMHTKRGRKMGRGASEFFHVGAALENASPFYDRKYIRAQKARYPLPDET
jgi:replication-associated recombination protein RarA